MKIWFMYDCHAFAAVANLKRGALIKRVKELFAEDGCGTLFVRDEYGGSLNSLNLDGHRLESGRYGVTDAEIEKWADQIEVERSFRTLMC